MSYYSSSYVQYPSIDASLVGCGLSKDGALRWSVRVGNAIATARFAEQKIVHESGVGAVQLTAELDRFHKSLTRGPKASTIIRRWKALSDTAKIFVEFDLNLDQPNCHGFAGLELSSAAHVKNLTDAVGRARRWGHRKSGTEHGPAIRGLVRDIALIYKQATGKRLGVSSSNTTIGPNYSTPFETLVSASLKAYGEGLSIEGVRSLIRSELFKKTKK